MHPGKLLNGMCYIGYGDSVIPKASYEVAVATSGLWGVPKNDFQDALVAGSEGNNQPLYLCRAKLQQNWFRVRRSGEPVLDRPGYHGTLPGKIVNEICAVTFDGKEIFLPDFEVFYSSNNPPKPPDNLRWSYGGTTLIFKNNSKKNLYAYHGMSDLDTQMHCSVFDVREPVQIRPGGTWSYRVLNSLWGWFKFRESTEGGGCSSNLIRFEKVIVGTALPKTQIVEVK